MIRLGTFPCVGLSSILPKYNKLANIQGKGDTTTEYVLLSTLIRADSANRRFGLIWRVPRHLRVPVVCRVFNVEYAVFHRILRNAVIWEL